MNFDEFGLRPEIKAGIDAAGFKQPSPIQEKAIPLAMEGRDMIGQAHTGTGKTAAFGLGLMHRMDMERGVELLVITPTRELAGQVSDELYKLGQHAGVRTTAIYGGQSYSRQIKLIDGGAQVVVATPGRMLDLLQGGKLRNFEPRMVVLDEADEMLDMGFLEDVQAIFEFLPEDRQTLMFSATMPKPIERLAQSILRDPEHVETMGDSDATNQDIEQLYFVIREHERIDALVRLIEDQSPDQAMLFCRTRQEVDNICDLLCGRGYQARALHGEMEQPARNRVMSAFRRGDFDLLVATDVAARGLDIPEVSHVFNVHIPFNSKSYIHRIGRTGRAGKKGVAITLATPREFRQIERLQKFTGSNIVAGSIPCLRQLRLGRLGRIQDRISEQAVLPEAMELVLEMETEIPPHEVAMRLLSMMLGEQEEHGPDRIGLSEGEVEKLGRPAPRERRERPGRRSRNERRGFERRDRREGRGDRRESTREDGRPARKRTDRSGETGTQGERPKSASAKKANRRFEEQRTRNPNRRKKRFSK